MTDLIRTEALVKSYGRRRGLAGLDLDVGKGEVYGFLGPNGAGKTTTIRILLDLIRPTSGLATLFGESPRRGGPALRRRVGYLPGDFTVLGSQTGRELLIGGSEALELGLGFFACSGPRAGGDGDGPASHLEVQRA